MIFCQGQKHDKSNQHEVIPISSNILEVLHGEYYNIHLNEEVNHLIQTSSQRLVVQCYQKYMV